MKEAIEPSYHERLNNLEYFLVFLSLESFLLIENH